MSSDLTRANVRAFLRKEHSPLVGFVVCFLFALLFQLTTVGILVVIAGGIAGFLLKRTVKTLLLTFAAGTLVWLMLFAIIYALHPTAFITAVILLSTLLPLPHLVISLVGGLLSAIGGELGVIVAEFVYPNRAEQEAIARQAPAAPLVPTAELPRRRIMKKRKRRRK
jgi:hypothetical protein